MNKKIEALEQTVSKMQDCNDVQFEINAELIATLASLQRTVEMLAIQLDGLETNNEIHKGALQ